MIHHIVSSVVNIIKVEDEMDVEEFVTIIYVLVVDMIIFGEGLHITAMENWVMLLATIGV